MNAKSQTVSPVSGRMGEAPGRSEPSRWSDRGPPRGEPPSIEHRRTPGPIAVYTGPDPVAVWPPRPGLARVGSQRPKSHGARMTLYLALGTFVFFAGAIRVASHLGYPAGPVIVHLLYSM